MSTPASNHRQVVVVGGGGSGLAAAIEAATAGSPTVLLEKNPILGGSTAWSVGSVTSSCTAHQAKAGIVDRTEWHWQDMGLFARADDARDNTELRKRLCEDVPETFEWLQRLGVRFFGPVLEPPHRVARMHTVLPNSGAFIYHLERRARKVGVDIRLGAAAEALRVYGDRVEGVGYRQGSVSGSIEAGAVVLAAGDFTSDPVFKTRFMGARAALVPGVNPTATGDGQRMAERIGARIVNGDLALGPELRFQPPLAAPWIRRLPPWTALATFLGWAMRVFPERALRRLLMKFLTTALAPSSTLFEAGALLVDATGERIRGDVADAAANVCAAPGNKAWIVIDGALAARFQRWPDYISTAPGIAYAYLEDYARNRRDLYHAADSIAGLAQSIGVDSLALENSLRSARRASASEPPPRAVPGQRPFCALGPVSAVFVHSEGGLMVDTEHRVLLESGRAVPGLYAAGSTGQGGLLLRGHGHHLAWAFTSGRRAGIRAAHWARSQ